MCESVSSAQNNPPHAKVAHFEMAYSDPLHSLGGRLWVGAQDFGFGLCAEALPFLLTSSYYFLRLFHDAAGSSIQLHLHLLMVQIFQYSSKFRTVREGNWLISVCWAKSGNIH